MFYPSFNTFEREERCDCIDCRPTECVGYDFFGRPVVQRRQRPQRPVSSYMPRAERKVERSPFGELFGEEFFGGFDDEMFGMKRRNVRPNYQRRNTAGKENMDPKFKNLPVPERPERPAKAETRAPRMTETRAPSYFKEELNSNTLVRNGNATTINKKTVTENDKTETFVTKITEDKAGNKAVTDLAPETYKNEVNTLFEENDAIIQEVPLQVEAEPVPAIVDENKMFEEKIKQSTVEKINSDDNKSAKSGGSSGNELFGDIKF